MKSILTSLIILLISSTAFSNRKNGCPQIGLDQEQALNEFNFSSKSCQFMGRDSLSGTAKEKKAELIIFLCRKNNQLFRVALAPHNEDLVNIMNSSMGLNCPTGTGQSVFWIEPISI